MTSGAIKNTPEGRIVDDSKRYFCEIQKITKELATALSNEGVK
jgi:hypothetical protein